MKSPGLSFGEDRFAHAGEDVVEEVDGVHGEPVVETVVAADHRVVEDADVGVLFRLLERDHAVDQQVAVDAHVVVVRDAHALFDVVNEVVANLVARIAALRKEARVGVVDLVVLEGQVFAQIDHHGGVVLRVVAPDVDGLHSVNAVVAHQRAVGAVDAHAIVVVVEELVCASTSQPMRATSVESQSTTGPVSGW